MWALFQRELVLPGGVAGEIAGLGPKTQRVREQTDYEGDELSVEEARAILADAERFVDATAAHLS